MPSLASLEIWDDAPTPAAHDFDPVRTDGSTAKWADRAPGIPAGFRTISFEVAEPSGNRTTSKAEAGFYIPVTATVDGSVKVIRASSARVILNMHPESTLQERKDLRSYVANFLAHADVKAAIENVEPVY